MNELTIKYQDLNLLVKGASMITMNPTGEEILIQLMELKDKVETAIIQAKSVIQNAISEIDPDLTSISSDRLKIMYRVYGMKYGLDQNCIEYLDPKFYTEKKSYSLNSGEVDKYIRENGTVPNGITLNDRSKTVSISLKDSRKEIEE